MKKKILSIALIAISGFAMSQMTVGAGNILYVKKGSTGNGSSWTNAAGELSDALKWANDNKTNWTNTPLQIWVAAGTYLPKYSPEDGLANPAAPSNPRMKSFLLVPNVKLYGGFVGSETMLSQRNWVNNKAILNGDFNGNDVVTGIGQTLTFANNDENAYNVVKSVGDVSDATLDGFTITGGTTGGPSSFTVNGYTNVSDDYGGGLSIQDGSPIIANCTISKNDCGIGSSAGIDLWNSDSKLSNLIISLNKSGHYAVIPGGSSSMSGGSSAIGFSGSNSVIENTVFYGNCNNVEADMINLFFSDITMINCTFTQNWGRQEYSSSSMIWSNYSNPNFINNIFWNNNVTSLVNNQNGSTPVWKNNIVQGAFNGATWNSSYGTNGGGNLNVDPQFTNAAINDFTLKSTSPAIDTGNNSMYNLSLYGYDDLALKPRLRNNVIDVGAYEFQKGNIALNVNPSSTNILYVKKGSTGDGSSWTNALGEVSDAMYWANRNKTNYTASSPLQIWVATGTYLPKYSYKDGEVDQLAPADPKMKTFFMTNNVKMYGGFLGTETSIGQRVFQWGNLSQEAVLSGDFSQNDAVTGYGSTLSITNNTENAYHVMTFIGDATNNFSNASIDGLRIGYGNASDDTSAQTINSFSLSNAYGAGLALYKANPVLRNVAITRNMATWDGAGIFLNNSSPKIYNAVIGSNIGFKGAGLIGYSSSNPVLTNVNIAYNISPQGAVYNDNSTFNLNNSIMYGNITAKTNPQISKVLNFSGASSNYNYNLLEGSGGSTAWNSSYGTNGGGNIDGDPKFLNVSNGDWNLLSNSPVINKGNNALYTSIGGDLQNDKDFISLARVYNYSSGGIIDMGAYEFQGTPASLATLENSTDIKTLKIYPNPTSGFFYINSDKAQKAVLYNVNGQIVQEFDLKVGENRQDISYLSAGLYLLKTSESAFKILKK